MSETRETIGSNEAARANAIADHVRVVRLGHGANCSSLGSVVDMLFASAVVGGALFAAIASALEDEAVTKVVPPVPETNDEEPDGDAP
jgi:hypothetical protein